MSDDIFTTYKATRDQRKAIDAQLRAREMVERYAPAIQAKISPPVTGTGEAAGAPNPGPSTADALAAISPVAGMGMAVADAAPAIASDVGRGLTEAPRAIVGGAIDGVNSAIGLIDDFAMWMEDKLRLGGPGMTHDELMAARAKGEGGVFQNGIPNLDRPESTTGNVLRAATGFLLPFGKIKKGVEGVYAGGDAVVSTVAGGLTAFMTSDQNEARLSDFWKEAGLPENMVTEYLASDPNDSVWDKRFKDTVEGLGLGLVGEGVVKGAKAMRAAYAETRAGGKAMREVDQVAAQEFKPVYTVDQLFLPQAAKGAKAGDALVIQGKLTSAEQAASTMVDELSGPFIASAGKVGTDKVFVNFARIDTPDDIKATIGKMADALSSNIDAARRGRTMTFDETKALADDLGFTPDDLLARTRGQPFNAETALAARRLLSASGTQLTKLAEKAAAAGATDADHFNFRRSLAMHAAIQNEVIAARTETARALASWRIEAGATEIAQTDIKAALDAFGGSETSAKIAQRIANLKAKGKATPAAIARVAEAGWFARTNAAITEAYVASMLSGPKTHIVNFTSGFGMSMMGVAERAVAGALPGSAVASGEAMAMLHGMVTNFRQAMSLGWQGLKSGEGGGAIGGKVELPARAISAAAFKSQGTLRGTVIDAVGSAFSIPGRLMVGADEFWKSLTMNAEINAQAVRQATAEGMTGPAYAERVRQLVATPTKEMLDEARDAALKGTFQEDLGGFGKALLKARNKAGLLGYIATPFLKTPLNIFRQAVERSPLAPLSAQWRADIAAGGVRASKATARAALGTTVALTAVDMANMGLITGAGPSDPEERAALMRQGWKPYSIKVGDAYYDYSRLDPIGMTIGAAASFGEWMSMAPPDSEELAARARDPFAALAVAVSQSVLNKTYMEGLSGLFDAMSNPDRYGEKEVKDILVGFMPFGSLSGTVERMVDPEVRLSAGVWEAVQAKIAGMSEGLPLRRNLWGEPVRQDSGLGSGFDNLSPIGVSKAKESAIDQELGRLRFFPAEIPFGVVSFNGAPIDMKKYPDVFSEYVRLSGNGVPDPLSGKGVKETLDDLVTGKDPRSEIYNMKTDGPEGGKAQMIKGIILASRERAQRAILNDPKFAAFRMFVEDQKRVKQERTRSMEPVQ